DGKDPGRLRDSRALAAAVAAHHEVLEAGPQPHFAYVVGSHRLAGGIDPDLAPQVAAHQRAELHLAAGDVLERAFGKDTRANGQDLYGQASQDHDSQGTARLDQASLLAVPARRQRRFARGLHPAAATEAGAIDGRGRLNSGVRSQKWKEEGDERLHSDFWLLTSVTSGRSRRPSSQS